MFRKSHFAAGVALTALGFASPAAFAWFDLPSGGSMVAEGSSASLPVTSASRSNGVQTQSYQLRVNQLVSGDSVPQAFCEDWRGNLRAREELNRDVSALHLRVDATQRTLPGTIFNRNVKALEARLLYRMEANGLETGTQHVDARGIKQRMLDPSAPVLGTKCTRSNPTNQAQDCSVDRDDLGLIQFSKPSESGDIQMRIMRPGEWGFSAAVVNSCANVVLVLSPMPEEDSRIQSASR